MAFIFNGKNQRKNQRNEYYYLFVKYDCSKCKEIIDFFRKTKKFYRSLFLLEATSKSGWEQCQKYNIKKLPILILLTKDGKAIDSFYTLKEIKEHIDKENVIEALT